MKVMKLALIFLVTCAKLVAMEPTPEQKEREQRLLNKTFEDRLTFASFYHQYHKIPSELPNILRVIRLQRPRPAQVILASLAGELFLAKMFAVNRYDYCDHEFGAENNSRLNSRLLSFVTEETGLIRLTQMDAPRHPKALSLLVNTKTKRIDVFVRRNKNAPHYTFSDNGTLLEVRINDALCYLNK